MGNEDIVGLMETHRCRNRLLKLCTEHMTKHVQQQALTTLKIQEEERRNNINNLQLCKNLNYINEELVDKHCRPYLISGSLRFTFLANILKPNIIMSQYTVCNLYYIIEYNGMKFLDKLNHTKVLIKAILLGQSTN